MGESHPHGRDGNREVYYTKSEKLVCKLMGEYDIAYQVGNSNKMVDSLFLKDAK